jgi:hypothetical protein
MHALTCMQKKRRLGHMNRGTLAAAWSWTQRNHSRSPVHTSYMKVACEEVTRLSVARDCTLVLNSSSSDCTLGQQGSNLSLTSRLWQRFASLRSAGVIR